VFPPSGFDSCAIGAVACPDSALPFLEGEFARLCALHRLVEIRAADMTPTSLRDVCVVLGASDVLWAAVYTDSRLLPVAQQEDFRRRQVKKADDGISKSQTLADDDELMADALRTRNRIRLSTRVGIAEYLEFLILFPRAIGDILAASLRAFRSARWEADFSQLRFESDRKLKTKLSMGEKTLAAALPRFLANNDQFILDIPGEWNHAHAFIAAHRDPTTTKISVPRILGAGIEFVDSASSVPVQVADVVAHVVRRATSNPTDLVAQDAYQLLRRRGFSTTRTPVRIFSDRKGPSGREHWYAHLL
jgi:hypothetical protein